MYPTYKKKAEFFDNEKYIAELLKDGWECEWHVISSDLQCRKRYFEQVKVVTTDVRSHHRIGMFFIFSEVHIQAKVNPIKKTDC